MTLAQKKFQILNLNHLNVEFKNWNRMLYVLNQVAVDSVEVSAIVLDMEAMEDTEVCISPNGLLS